MFGNLGKIGEFSGTLRNPLRRFPAMPPGILWPSIKFEPDPVLLFPMPASLFIAQNAGMEAEDFYSGICWTFDVRRWEELEGIVARATYQLPGVITGLSNPVNLREFSL